VPILSELVPNTSAGRFFVSEIATQFASGLTFCALGLYSIPAESPGRKVYVSVVRMVARGI